MISSVRGTEDVPIVVCGNKLDVVEEERRISVEEIHQRAKCTALEVSAKCNTNVEPVFHELLRRVVERRAQAAEQHENGSKSGCSVM